MDKADLYIANFVHMVSGALKPPMLDGIEATLTEYFAFRDELHVNYSAAPNIALDYLMLMKGEHGLVEYLFHLTLGVKMKFQKYADKECVICTWWRPGDRDEQPLLQVKKYVGPTLGSPHSTEIVFLQQWQQYAEQLWSLVPIWSFLRCGLEEPKTVLRFEVDEIDAFLENATPI